MRTYTKEITPKLAVEWVSKISPEKQRKISESTVTAYANAMRSGHWTLNHQGIAFDEHGNLADGQHRLLAVIQSGASVMMQVTEGMPEKQGDLYTFDSIDGGRKRGIGSNLQVRHGIQNANNFAAAARVIAMICTRRSIMMSTANTLAILDYFGKDIDRVLSAMELSAFRKGGILGGLAFARKFAGTKLDDFIDRVGDGDGAKSGTPEYAYRKFILNNGFNDNRCIPQVSARVGASCAMNSLLGNGMSKVVNSMVGIDFFCDKQPRVVENIRKMFVQ